MKVFRLNHHEYDSEIYPTRYVGTLVEAKKEVKEVPKHLRRDIVVTELDMQSDKEGFLAALNDEAIVTSTLREFSITARGGLQADE